MSYLITQSIIGSWSYALSAGTEEAWENFMTSLRREKTQTTSAQQAGLDFEDACYKLADGIPVQLTEKIAEGVAKVVPKIRGGCFQVKASREIEVDGETYLVYGILDCLKAGQIIDLKFTTHSLRSTDVYGKYLDSPQHPFYFYIVPEAYKFTYLVSDGEEVYEEPYERSHSRGAESIIREFIDFIKGNPDLWKIYKEKWVSR